MYVYGLSFLLFGVSCLERGLGVGRGLAGVFVLCLGLVFVWVGINGMGLFCIVSMLGRGAPQHLLGRVR